MTGLLSRRFTAAPPPRPRRPAPRTVAIGVLVVLVSAVLVWLVAFSPVLVARSVSVHGNHTLTTAQVRGAASVPGGRPLIRLDTAALRRRVEALPGVASARVTVSYPSTVVITVIERAPVGYLRSGSSYLLIDKFGVQFRTTSRAPAQLPHFDLPDGAGGQPDGQAVAIVAGSLPANVLPMLTSIKAPSPADVTLLLRDGRTVIWGSAERSADKARLVTALLKQPGKSFDVSNPDLVVVR